MNYEEMVEKLANEIIDEATGTYEEEIEVEAEEFDIDEYMQEKIAANLADLEDGYEESPEEKVAAYYEHSQALKTAASEAYLEAEIMEKAAIEVLDELGYFAE